MWPNSKIMPEGSILQRNTCFLNAQEGEVAHTHFCIMPGHVFQRDKPAASQTAEPTAICPAFPVLTGHPHNTVSCSHHAKGEPEPYLVGLQANDGGIHLDGDKDLWLVDNV